MDTVLESKSNQDPYDGYTQPSDQVTHSPLTISLSRGGNDGGISYTPIDITVNNLNTFSPSNGNFPVTKWYLQQNSTVSTERDRQSCHF